MSIDTFPQSLNTLDQDRIKRYRENLDFYNGNQWPSTNRRERQLTFNYVKTFVEKITSYLMSGITPSIIPLDSSEAETERARKAEVALTAAYEQNSLDLLDFDTEIDCSILGDAAYKVTWDSKEKRVRVTAPDVQGIFVWWRGDDMSTIYRLASRYTLTSDEVQTIYHIVPAAKTATIVEDWTDKQFILYLDNEALIKSRNPYGFIPFVVYPNLREPKSFWGVSDLIPLLEPQRELNRSMSQLSRILELSGNPIAVLENVEESEDIAVKPGAVWNLPEGARAYLLDLLKGGGVRLHLNYIDLIYRTMHDLSEAPRAAFGGTDRDLSGTALQIELQSLIQKVIRKRLIRSAAYRRRNDMILRLLDAKTTTNFKGLSTRVVWSPVLPQDLLRLAQTEQLLVNTGLHSRNRAMTELTILNPQDELKRIVEERKLLAAGASDGRTPDTPGRTKASAALPGDGGFEP